MKAIILAGGRGKRLRPITDYVPKSLIPLKNTPIIEWQIKYLKEYGVNEVIICTGYKTKMIENYLGMSNLLTLDDFNIYVKIVDQNDLIYINSIIKIIENEDELCSPQDECGP